MREVEYRLYATFRTTPDLLGLYRARDLPGLTGFTTRLLVEARRRRPQAAAQPEPAALASAYRIVSLPSLNWRPAFVGGDPEAPSSAAELRDAMPAELIIVYAFRDIDAARGFLAIVNDFVANELPETLLDTAGNALLGSGFDPGGSVADHWCPGAANRASFGHRDHARRTMRAGALVEHGLRGQSVNVVIIDEGLDRALIPHKNWGGGLDHYIDEDLVLPAGAAPPTSHGMMIARSVLDLAPDARLYDVPVIPATRSPTVPVFVSTVHAAYLSLVQQIRARRSIPEWSGPWVLVNAWGIFDTSSDPFGSYTRNTEPGGHPMINLVTHIVQTDRLDIVFAAGNCGEFCPSSRCGRRDRGPAHSIWGANAHPRVITVGAVRSDETWIGYSSQGPGPAALAINKPDLCAPTQFCEDYDAAMLSSGSSAACAMAAGVVAALRGNPKWTQTDVTPDLLKTALTQTARKPHGAAEWHARWGCGILDAAAAIGTLPA